jgi:lysozyme
MNYDKIKFFSPRLTLFGAIGLLLILLGLLYQNQIYKYFYNKWNCDDHRKRKYLTYQTPIPKGYAVYGMDISSYQCAIDWAAVTRMNAEGARIRFAFLRATRGSREQDILFQYNWTEARQAGILRGAYHYFYASEDALSQANNFLQLVRVEAGDLPPVLDIENGLDEKTDAEIVTKAAEWLKIVEKSTGVRPIIYCNLSYYNRLFADGKFAEYPFWIARYADNNGQMPRAPQLRDGRQWHFWQFSEKANINGISEKADLDIFIGNFEQLKALTKR